MATSKKKTAGKKPETREATPYTEVFEKALEEMTAAIEMLHRREYGPALERFVGLAAKYPDELVFGGRCRSFAEICRRHDPSYEEGVITVVDDSHGVGAFGETGRGTEEYCGAACDVLVATLGKALGVNGGFEHPADPRATLISLAEAALDRL